MKAEVEFDADLNGWLQAVVSDSEDMQPWTVVAESPYAAYVEFGTRPSSKPMSKEVMKRFRQWAHAKGLDPSVAYRAYKSVHDHGMRPAPFLRPAMYRVMDGISSSTEPYTSVKDIAEAVADEAVQILWDEGSFGSGEPLGHLVDSIKAVPGDDAIVGESDMLYQDESLWTDPNQGIRDGKEDKYTRPRSERTI